MGPYDSVWGANNCILSITDHRQGGPFDSVGRRGNKYIICVTMYRQGRTFDSVWIEIITFYVKTNSA